MHKNKNGSYDVRVVDVKACATWLEWSGATKKEAHAAVLSFLKSSAKDHLTFKINKATLKVYKEASHDS